MQLPGPVRAVVGLLASAADEAKSLPDRAVELPMLAVSTALQLSLRAQQRYARLAARGDAVINRRPDTDEPPPWATFDDPVPAEQLRAEQLRAEPDAAPEPVAAAPAAKAPARKAPAKKTSAKKAPAKKAPASKSSGPSKSSGKTISPPRHTAPSRFDTVGDE